MSRPRLLDLFCGAGGAAMGYYRAGFDVVGVDIRPQPRYPFRFWQYDVLELEPWVLSAFDAVHASPPCQRYSRATPVRCRAGHPDLIEPTRDLLERGGRPWVIENVPLAPLRNAVMICGGALGHSIDDYMQLHRHRYFESSVGLFGLPCTKIARYAVTAAGHGSAQQERRTLGRGATQPERRELMQIDWMNRTELAESIPPSYAEWVGWQLLAAL